MAIKRLNLFVIIVIGVLGYSCEEYVSDPLDPRIPAFTQNGENDAGCYINGSVWRTDCNAFTGDCPSWSVSYDSLENKSRFAFSGEVISAFEDITLYMELHNTRITSFGDLERILNKRFVFGANGSHRAYLSSITNSNDSCFSISEQYGEFTVRSIGQTEGEENSENYFAGTFGYDLNTPCGYFEVYKGRFDHIVSPSKFRYEDF